MSKSMRIVMAVALVGFVAACAKKVEEEVVFIDEPVSVEPTYTGKYK
jgi:hypothetical protein